MKLCDVAQAYHPSSGGIKTYLEAKRAAAAASGLEHVLIVPGERHGITRDGAHTIHTVGGPPIPGCAPYRLLLRFDRVLAILERERPDVIEVDSPYLAPWAALLHRRRACCAVVAFHHTDVPRAYVEPLVRRLVGARAARLARRAALRYQRALYRRCDLVVAASPRVERRLRRSGVARTAVVPLGVDLEHFHPRRRDPGVRARLGVAPHEPLLVYAGRLDSEKRPDIVADAFAQLRPGLGAHLVLVGEGPLKPALLERARRDPRLHVLPYETDRTALATLLASADMYVSAAPHETFGLSVAEAQAAGLPIVGVRAGAMVERVTPDTGHLADPNSPSSLAAAIETLWRNGRSEFGARARRLAETAYSWHRTFERLIPLYHDAHVGALHRREHRQPVRRLAQPAIR